jgi:hypothetical protein
MKGQMRKEPAGDRGAGPCGRLLVAALCLALVLLAAGPAAARLTEAQLQRIGNRIFFNECGGKTEHLVAWNEREAFASLGIGHFIWYPAGVEGPYDESFVDLIRFMRGRQVALPPLLLQNVSPDCPWPDRDAFLKAAGSPEMATLRLFLQQTIPLQTRFMLTRLEAALPRILGSAPPDKRRRIRLNYGRVARFPMGVYALADYVNFKGEGVLSTERINGAGWGLRQVLEEMDPLEGTINPLAAFSRSATRVLTRRAVSDPRPVVRERWLPGWLARVRTYAPDH